MSSIKIIQEDKQALEPVNQTLCEICQKQFSNYVCPRCNLRYCSLACYKGLEHADCTESFYKESVTAEIQNRELDKDSKNKMLEMLKRLEEENDPNDLIDSDDQDEDEHENELVNRFANIDIENTDPDLIWGLLSDKERMEFEQVLKELEKTGDWNKLDIPSYQPWWKQHVMLVQDSDEEDNRPVLPNTIPDFTKMTQPATRSSPHLAWNLLHLLATYSYLMRHSLGDLLEDSQDTIKVCQTLSANVLYSNAADCPFQNVGDVVGDVTERIIDREDTATRAKQNFNNQRRYDLKILILQDMEALLNDRIRAIYDFWQAMNQIATATKKNKKPLLLATRKLYFYLAAAGYLDSERLKMIRLAIQNEINRVKTEKEEFLRDFEVARDAIQRQKQQRQDAEKIKIQEL